MIDAREQSSVSSSGRSPRLSSTRSARKTTSARRNNSGIERVFSSPEQNPFDQLKWDRRTAEITDDAGKVIFKQEDVEVPETWSVLATKVVVSKYFYGEQNTPERERSVRQLVHRVCRTIADWGIKDGYFSEQDGEVFCDELTWLCVNQHGSFNSPVWFNVGKLDLRRNVCAVPLLEAPIPKGMHFSTPALPGERIEPMPEAQLPAPSCGDQER